MILKHIKRLTDAKATFEKAMSDLKTITPDNIEQNKKISKIIKWYRLEYLKIPEQYPGDYTVLEILRDYMLTGYDFKNAIKLTRKNLKNKLNILRLNRSIKL
jgi:hypothetical protein